MKNKKTKEKLIEDNKIIKKCLIKDNKIIKKVVLKCIKKIVKGAAFIITAHVLIYDLYYLLKISFHNNQQK